MDSQNIYLDALIYSQMQQSGAAAVNKELLERTRRGRWRQYQIAKRTRTYYLPVEVNLTGVSGQNVTGYSDSVNHDLILVAATGNCQSANFRVTVRETGQNRLWASDPVSPAALFGDVANSTQRYLRYPVPYLLPAQSQLAVTIINDSATTQVVTLIFQCLWIEDDVRTGGISADAALDESVQRFIASGEPQHSVVVNMVVPFTSGASERVTAKSTQVNSPLLVVGVQQNLNTKTGAPLTEGPTARFTDLSSLQSFSSEEIPLWAQANYSLSDPVPWLYLPKPFLLRPNGVLRGDFTNMAGTTGALSQPLNAGRVSFLCRTP
jgi:hypothetical protein